MTKSFTTRLVGLTAIAASALAISAHAFAQSAGQGYDQSSHVRVSYSDLDTSRPEGRAELKSRIEAAAEQACGGPVDVRDLDRQAWASQCRARAIQSAMSRFSASQVAMAGSSTTGR